MSEVKIQKKVFTNLSVCFRTVIVKNQSHYREVPWWEIFTEQELRFWLNLGRMTNFPAFIASKSFDLCNHHTSQKCF